MQIHTEYIICTAYVTVKLSPVAVLRYFTNKKCNEIQTSSEL